MMRPIGRALRGAADLLALLGAVALVWMMVQVAADVALKNLVSLNAPFTQTLATKWAMVAAAFLPLALTEVLDRHISVEIAFQHFPPRARRIVGGAVCLYASVVTAALVWPMWTEALKRFAAGSFELEAGEAMITWPPFFFLPLGFGLFSAVLLHRAVVLWTGAESGMGETRIDAPASDLPRADH
ncbi:MAG: TRAP transporter small permease [Pseudomonadota bacterium]|nr:TRAP transporter small permease [Pseudomonadota bacterium]MEE3099628.1 TRAP transporter small permease [Pseudomonadota bacterium]